ncbi:hypothetical protein [Nannocystis bainbridge]|uniref:Uncharacterized protein n=1 Tax=Nannocystis bainbridge TaxID=2995303 RepID=A0ABT5E815_9BACT|nr:hypothetical protein [Nannocystis bainbridge]MDC0721999.1 hypothetical protein [Nannocystis bainbridge]
MNVYLAGLGGLLAFLLVCLLLNARRVGLFGWIFLGALMVTCAITNPDKERHTGAVKDALVSHEKTAAGRLMLNAFAGGIVGSSLDYSNFVFFSITGANGQAVSLGLLTQVVVFPFKTEER